MSNRQSQFNNYITIAKSIGIILMVLGHIEIPSLLKNFIYVFHMPLFFFCSGYLFKDIKSKDEFIIFLKKKYKGLYIPFIKWCFLFLLAHNVLAQMHIYSNFYNFNELYYKIFKTFIMYDEEPLLGGFWFLRILFFSTCIMGFLLYIIKYKYKIESILFITLILTIISKIYPYSSTISLTLLGSIYYCIGILYKKYEKYIQVQKVYFLLPIIIIGSIYYPTDMPNCNINNIIQYIIISTIGILLIISLSKKIVNFHGISLLFYIGNKTLIILALHFISFKIIDYIKYIYYDLPVETISSFPTIKTNNNIIFIIGYLLCGILIPILTNSIYIKLVQIKKRI